MIYIAPTSGKNQGALRLGRHGVWKQIENGESLGYV